MSSLRDCSLIVCAFKSVVVVSQCDRVKVDKAVHKLDTARNVG